MESSGQGRSPRTRGATPCDTDSLILDRSPPAHGAAPYNRERPCASTLVSPAGTGMARSGIVVKFDHNPRKHRGTISTGTSRDETQQHHPIKRHPTDIISRKDTAMTHASDAESLPAGLTQEQVDRVNQIHERVNAARYPAKPTNGQSSGSPSTTDASTPATPPTSSPGSPKSSATQIIRITRSPTHTSSSMPRRWV